MDWDRWDRRSILAIVLSAFLLVSLVGAAALTFSSTYNATTGVTYGYGDSGPDITLGYDAEVASGNPYPEAGTVDLHTKAGNATFSATANVSATLDSPTGTTTELSSMNVSAGELTINPDDKQAVRVTGDTDHLSFRSAQLDDGTQDFSYGGPDGGTTTLTITDREPGVVILAVNQSGVKLDKAVVDSNGEVTLALPQSDHTVELQSSDISDPAFSNPTPTGPQSTTPDELAVNVSDDDFPNDEVEVNISLDGTQIHSENITEDSRVNVSIGDLDPGAHNWTVEATDQYGNTETKLYEFGTPNNLSVYNESAPTQLVDDREVTVTVFSDGEQVFERSTTNGTISLDGLPATQDLVVVTEADGYITRSAIIEDITVQNDVYILNENVSTVEVRFELDDPTGNFPPATTELFIKKPLNTSNDTRFRTIAADQFGTEGFTLDLEQDERYRLEIKNQDGDRQVLGSYTASVSETVVLTPTGLVIDYDGAEGYAWDATYDNETGNPSIVFEYSDPQQLTSTLEVTIYERGNESNTLSGYPETFVGPLGNVTIEEALTEEQTNKEWVVEWEADRDGEVISAKEPVGEYTVVLPGLDPFWAEAFAFAVILITGGLFSRANVGVGAVTVALVAGVFYWIGWLAGATSGVAVILGLGLSVIVWAQQSGGI